jgi:hypothetical protein
MQRRSKMTTITKTKSKQPHIQAQKCAWVAPTVVQRKKAGSIKPATPEAAAYFARLRQNGPNYGNCAP